MPINNDTDKAALNNLPVVAIVGRPNVGKSTLFNRLVGRRMALVYDQPGVTRDRKIAKANFAGMTFTLMDTPGLFDPGEGDQPAVVTEGMRKQALKALSEASVILFVIDGRLGCTPYDQDLANMLRKQKAPVIVLVNKAEGRGSEAGVTDAHCLGLGEVAAISAEHGMGMSELEEFLSQHITVDYGDDEDAYEYPSDKCDEDDDNEEEVEFIPKHSLKIAILGRPNVGKSTLVNALLEEEAQLTADYPGVTRDSIAFQWTYKDRAIELVDTAGIRRKSKVDGVVEKLAVYDAERTMRFAEIVVLVIDASIPTQELIEKQDLMLASYVIEEGRGLIIALNKWDQVKNPEATYKHVQEQLEVHLTQARGIRCVTLSALKGQHLTTLMDEVLVMEKMWNRRIPTATLNRWLQFTVEAHPTPIVAGHRIRLKYMTQIKSRPPTFKVFCTKASDLPDSYVRYLTNSLRRDFKMPAVPIRFQFKTQKNPYELLRKKK
ncbi:MAG: ribosome biogenesis GTPase Der [Candidatus Paracaedibacteraceae bacterium]|nr:ribosome biogenesis GTPase Der [Candidatus Paracaedibacteraceae bacterium]